MSGNTINKSLIISVAVLLLAIAFLIIQFKDMGNITVDLLESARDKEQKTREEYIREYRDEDVAIVED